LFFLARKYDTLGQFLAVKGGINIKTLSGKPHQPFIASRVESTASGHLDLARVLLCPEFKLSHACG